MVIANRFGDASGAAKAQLWETYDRLRDLTVSGSGTGTGFESAGGLLYNLASLLAPSSFATVFGGSETMNISGTSYYSKQIPVQLMERIHYTIIPDFHQVQLR